MKAIVPVLALSLFAPTTASSGAVPAGLADLIFAESFENAASCGFWSATVTPETCDGADNDCDTTVDEDPVVPLCALQLGVCAGKRPSVCAGMYGWLACDASEYGPDYELIESTCDTLDNDCDGELDEGFDLKSDVLNCGACGVVCPTGPNAEPVCNETCSLSCTSGFFDANGHAADGCECQPSGAEVCDSIDNDCNGAIDEGLAGCLSVPYLEMPSPMSEIEQFETGLSKVDAYVLIDLSGSMSAENASIRNSISAVAANVTCPPAGSGTPGNCIPDIWWGAGSIGYSGAATAYSNHLDLQSDPSQIAAAIPTTEPTGCCNETTLLALWSTVTGLGSASSGCSIPYDYGGRASCTASPAGSNGVGYPCFRPDALPVVLVATDEAPTVTFNCPTAATVIAIANSVGARIVGLEGAFGDAQLTTDLEALATGTGAVDSTAGNAPLVFSAVDANAANAIEDALLTLATGLPIDLSIEIVDDPLDAVDVAAEFIERVETHQLGTVDCSDGNIDVDTNADGVPDTFLGIVPGTPLCWQLILKQNLTVPAGVSPQSFPATLNVLGDGVTILTSRGLVFTVPAVP